MRTTLHPFTHSLNSLLVLLCLVFLGPEPPARASDASPNSATEHSRNPSTLEASSPWKATFALGLPTPIRLGAEYSWLENLDLAFEAGYFPYPSIGKLSPRSGFVETSARFFPGWGALFFSFGLGYQIVEIGTSFDLGSLSPSSGPTPLNIHAGIFYSSLSAGCQWRVSHRILLGFELGAQFPLLNAGGLSFKNNEEIYRDLAEAAAGPLSYLSGWILPRLTLLKMSYHF